MRTSDVVKMIGIKAGIIFLALYWFLVYFLLSSSLFICFTWGEIDLLQLLFFVQVGVKDVNMEIVSSAFFICFVIPMVSTLFMFYFWKLVCEKKSKLWGGMLIYFDIVVLCVVICCIASQSLMFFNDEKIDFYRLKYSYVDTQTVKQKYQRNLIVVFVESLENKFTVLENKTLKIDDEDAVSFDDMTEGYAQRWTQGALFSAFTGVHIHYISESFLGKMAQYLRHSDVNILLSNKAGRQVDFDFPNIVSLGNITHAFGYQNLFMQGGSTVFSGTKNFLMHNGFEEKNIVDSQDFREYPNYSYLKKWWGIDDTSLFGMAKKKIEALDINKPFFVTIFTIDLHFGKNPFYENDDEIRLATIKNLNDFIKWFKKQDFYENTTLVIVGDHKRMGNKVVPGGGIYNAFFNLPDNLSENLNVHRTFNQIDMFPTMLEILGFDVPNHKAGMGNSLFSKEKTLAENYSYDEQREIFTKIDDFYQKLWSKEKIQYLKNGKN